MSGRKNRNRANGRRKNPAALGDRGRNVQPRVSVNDVRRISTHGKAYSKNASRVHSQITKCTVNAEPVLASADLSFIDASGHAATIRTAVPSRGITGYTRNRVTVTIGLNGFGFLIQRHDATGWGGIPTNAGTAINQANDCAYTTNTFSGTAFDTISWNPTAGHVGIASISSTIQCPYSDAAGKYTGDLLVAVLGQKWSLAANKSSVTSRQGAITVVNHMGVLNAELTADTYNTSPRARTFDAADLTPDSAFTNYRPPFACGKWITWQNDHAGYVTSPFGSGASGAVQARKSGWTVITCTGNPGDMYVFEVETAMVYGGNDVPPQIPFCYDAPAYSVVACGIARGTESSSTVTDESGSRVGQVVHRDMERASTAFIPDYVHESLWDVGGKLFKRVLDGLMGLV